MGTIILIIVLLIAGINIGFIIGFSRAMREAASKMCGARKPVAGRVVAIIGSLGLLVSFGSWIYTIHFTHVAARTNGTVIEMQQQTDKENGSIGYAPTFRFQDAAGNQHTVSSGFFQSPPEFHVGDIVPVLYLSDSPQTARIDTFWQVWGLPSLAGILGSAALSVGVVILLWPKMIAKLGRESANALAANEIGQT
ncbi:DUF3592 domain-containing protein [bacterium]|nr:DUF3592 domain-containing protein [bacterium]